MNILVAGDIFGAPGRAAFARSVLHRKTEGTADFVVANAENAAAGKGITNRLAAELLDVGADILTLGDHTWDQRTLGAYLETESRVVRPLNFAPGCPGHGVVSIETGWGRVSVVSVVGRVFMPPVDCPFRAMDACLAAGDLGPIILVDVHAEATSEKIVMGRYLDGRVTAVVGTHTHVPTADACILPKGTAYITDLGMSGPYESVLGREIDPVLNKFLHGMPRRFGVAEHDVRTSGALIELESNKATSIQLITDRKPAAEGEEELA